MTKISISTLCNIKEAFKLDSKKLVFEMVLAYSFTKWQNNDIDGQVCH